jgi:NADPH2:quinone reductase
MRASVHSAENTMPTVMEVPAATPKPGEVLVKVAACGINFADTLIRRGRYLSKAQCPFIPGFEFSGTVTKGAGPWSEGDRVMGMGAQCYAEYVAAPAATLLPMPSGFSDEEAAAFPVIYLTAMAMLRHSVHAAEGETILITAAAGGVGTASIQLAKALGLTVIATASSEAKLALARSLGADFAVSYLGQDFTEPVKAFTGGRGVDIIFESTGGDALERDLEVAAPFGRIVVFGAANGPSPDLNVLKLFRNSVSVAGFWMNTLTQNQDVMNRVVGELIDIVERHGIRPVIGKVYPLDQAAQAWLDMERRHSTGKLLLRP